MARESYEEARALLELAVEERPADDRILSPLGLTYAGESDPAYVSLRDPPHYRRLVERYR